ncbi:TetR/AcrR family transcriptional regulator [Planctomycetaceae bacterium AH-315-I19]|nr:TetR/AcrR family transcriptional regulator [Planctomycetaceae bacterium AH-315-I19]
MTRLPAAQRREQLLDTAVTLFAERGFGGATTSELARAAGVTEPIIYRHFKSKKKLFVAVIDRTSELTIERWDRQLSSAKDAAQRLRRLIGTNPMSSDRGRGIYRVILQAMMEIEDPEILEAIQRHVTALHQFVTDGVRRAQDEGWVSRAFSPEVTAWTLLHLGLGYGVLSPLGIDGHAMDDKGVRVRDLIEQMMLGEKARKRQDDMLEHRETDPG